MNERIGLARKLATPLSADELHEAADVIGTFGEEDDQLAEYGLPFADLKNFGDNSQFRTETGEPIATPLGLALGVSIGVIAMQEHLRKARSTERTGL